MKKIAFLLMVSLMSLCLIGCGGGGDKGENARDITSNDLKNFKNGDSVMVLYGGTVTARLQLFGENGSGYTGEMIFGEREDYDVRVTFPGQLPSEDVEQVSEFTMQIDFLATDNNVIGEDFKSAAGTFFGVMNSENLPMFASGRQIKMIVQNGVGTYIWPYTRYAVGEGEDPVITKEEEKTNTFIIRDSY